MTLSNSWPFVNVNTVLTVREICKLRSVRNFALHRQHAQVSQSLLGLWIVFHIYLGFQIILMCVIYYVGVVSPWQHSDLHKTSYVLSLVVFTSTLLSANVSLIETLTTADKQDELQRKLDTLDDELFYFLKKEIRIKLRRIFKVQVLIYGICPIMHFTLITLGPFIGFHYFYLYPALLIKVRIFQITLWVDSLTQRIKVFNNKLSQSLNNRELLKAKRICNLFIDVNSLVLGCCEKSLLFITACHFLDFIFNAYWFLLSALHLFTWYFMPMCFVTALPLVMEFVTLSYMSQTLVNMVSSFLSVFRWNICLILIFYLRTRRQ